VSRQPDDRNPATIDRITHNPTAAGRPAAAPQDMKDPL